ncbi:BppU family phage baseplate upper protein [Clostridium pasteurianum]|uniref:Lysophospholipase L1-like esterase n=1 Tax=Clostridium pasteurianum BC1 TaxID=86416 RepID=R4K7M2_CLOPA|nr:BppU family phage baseplate upper protein [Clostridium pasteurianum]AGK95640.1 lysophospholipase L1-like esterase [Clostridium pasteurianum BC1]
MILPYNATFDLKGNNSKIDNIKCTVGDTNAYQLNVSIIIDKDAANLTGHTAKITFTKADKTKVFDDMIIDDAVNGKMYVIFKSQVIAFAGRVDADIEIYDSSNGRLTTGSFAFMVGTGQLDDTAIVSTNQFTALDTALAEVTDFVNTKTELQNARQGKASLLVNLQDKDSQAADIKTYKENGNRLYNVLHRMLDALIVKIICYGDSITTGQIPIAGGQAVDNYPAVLQTKLRKIYNNNNITVINQGNPGMDTTFGLANIDTQVISQTPDLCILMWGTNDGTERMDLATFKDNWRQMIKKCLKAGIEVLVLTCHTIYKPDDDRMHRQELYAKATIEIAKEMNVQYINMFEETSNIVSNKIEVPIVLHPDMVHFDQNKYFYISDIVINNALAVDDFKNILQVNDDIVVPIWHSPYIQTDIPATAEYDQPLSDYKKTISLAADTSKGTYLRFVFFNKKKNMNLVLAGSKGSGGGKVTIVDNGVNANMINFYSGVGTPTLYDVPNTAVENLSYGLHIIEILNTNIVLGQATAGVGSGYFTVFKIMKNKNINTSSYGSNAPFTPEAHMKIIDGVMKLTDGDATKNSQLVLNDREFIELKTGKTLVIEAQGTFINTGGISWFNNKPSTAFPSGYAFSYNSGNATIYKSDGTTYSVLLAGATALDNSVERTYRITMTAAGVITAYIDGTQVLQVTDTTENAGYVGVYSGVGAIGTITIKRLEYCYI